MQPILQHRKTIKDFENRQKLAISTRRIGDIKRYRVRAVAQLILVNGRRGLPKLRHTS